MNLERQHAFDQVLAAAGRVINEGADPSELSVALDEYALVRMRQYGEIEDYEQQVRDES